ncbi:MAG: hypothetical protein GY913_14820 [Proteobacteria bacterium]|nr:hypothetical protein [Pseudomonadota bacterium]MCP4918183.1 hypothetical protein [Pseudomonadota bacterium]
MEDEEPVVVAAPPREPVRAAVVPVEATPAPEAQGTATVVVEGDADQIRAVFSGGEAVSTGSITVAAGETRTLRCSAGFTICK